MNSWMRGILQPAKLFPSWQSGFVFRSSLSLPLSNRYLTAASYALQVISILVSSRTSEFGTPFQVEKMSRTLRDPFVVHVLSLPALTFIFLAC